MKRKKTTPRPPGPIARLPLPKKAAQRHADARKLSRAKEKERLRRQSED